MDHLTGPVRIKSGKERFGLTAIPRPDKLQLQSCHRHFLLPFDDSLNRPFETTVSYRSYDTHFFANTDN
jgi:hypothetical protein